MQPLTMQLPLSRKILKSVDCVVINCFNVLKLLIMPQALKLGCQFEAPPTNQNFLLFLQFECAAWLTAMFGSGIDIEAVGGDWSFARLAAILFLNNFHCSKSYENCKSLLSRKFTFNSAYVGFV